MFGRKETISHANATMENGIHRGKAHCFSSRGSKVWVTDTVWSARESSVFPSILRCKSAPHHLFSFSCSDFVIFSQLLINYLPQPIHLLWASFSPGLCPSYLTNSYSSFQMASFKKILLSAISLIPFPWFFFSICLFPWNCEDLEKQGWHYITGKR